MGLWVGFKSFRAQWWGGVTNWLSVCLTTGAHTIAVEYTEERQEFAQLAQKGSLILRSTAASFEVLNSKRQSCGSPCIDFDMCRYKQCVCGHHMVNLLEYTNVVNVQWLVMHRVRSQLALHSL